MMSSDYRMFMSAAVSGPKSNIAQIPNTITVDELKKNYGFSRGKIYDTQDNIFVYRKDNQILLVQEEGKMGIVKQNYFTIK